MGGHVGVAQIWIQSLDSKLNSIQPTHFVFVFVLEFLTLPSISSTDPCPHLPLATLSAAIALWLLLSITRDPRKSLDFRLV